MEMKRSIDAPPEVGVFDGDHFAVMLPSPVVGAPFLQAAIEHAVEARTFGDQGHPRRLGQGLETPHKCEQFETFSAGLRLGILDLHRVRAVVGLERKGPPAGPAGSVGARME